MKRFGWPLAGVLILIIFLSTFIIVQTGEVVNLTGKVTAGSQVNVIPARQANCSVSLDAGYNEISFFCLTTLEELSIVDDLEYDYIFTYRSSDVNDPWKVTKGGLPIWVVQDLEYLSRTEGYIINMNSADTFFKVGQMTLPTSIDLREGWNLAGYPTNATKNVSDSFTTINDTYTFVQTYNRATDAYETHSPPNNGFNTTFIYQAYWINVSANDLWEVS
jgi:hypothetical protein